MRIEIEKRLLGYIIRGSKRSYSPRPLRCTTDNSIKAEFPWYLSLEDLKKLRDEINRIIDENYKSL